MKRLSRYKWQKRMTEVFERDGRACKMCGRQFNLDVHHIIRRSKNGSDEMENLILLCRDCHNAQHKEKQTRWTPGLNAMREQVAKEFTEVKISVEKSNVNYSEENEV